MDKRLYNSSIVIVTAALCITGAAKYAFAVEFQGAILNQVPLGLWPSGALASIVPSLEMVLAALVAFPATRHVALCCGVILMAVFVLWKGILISLGYTGDCGCMGILATLPVYVTIWIDVGLLVAMIYAVQRSIVLRKQLIVNQ